MFYKSSCFWEIYINWAYFIGSNSVIFVQLMYDSCLLYRCWKHTSTASNSKRGSDDVWCLHIIESHMSNEFDIKETTVLFFFFSADDSGSGVGVCGLLLTWISWLLVVVTLPFSLCVCFKVSLTYWNSIGNSTSPNLTYLTKRSSMPWRSFSRKYFTHLPSFFGKLARRKSFCSIQVVNGP